VRQRLVTGCVALMDTRKGPPGVRGFFWVAPRLLGAGHLDRGEPPDEVRELLTGEPAVDPHVLPARVLQGRRPGGWPGWPQPGLAGTAGWVHRPLTPSGCAAPSGDSGAAMSRRTDPTIGATSRNPGDRGATWCSPIGVSRRNRLCPGLATISWRPGPTEGPGRVPNGACGVPVRGREPVVFALVAAYADGASVDQREINRED
jgi:hypothetical protein